MKRLLACVMLVAALAAPAAAATTSEITVTAEGRSSTMPDMATANFAISTFAASAASATSDNNSRYNRLLEALDKLGIAKSDVRTTSFSLNYNPPPKPPDVPQQGARYGYQVMRGVSVTVHQLGLVG